MNAPSNGLRSLAPASLVCAGALLLGLPAAALADEEVRAGAGNRFTNRDVTIDQGEKLFLRNQDPFAQHNVFSTGSGGDGALFKSDTVGNGVRTIVEGAQYLTTGTYNFVCTLHAPGMAGTLRVSSAGQPLPRPGAGVPDTVAPAVSLSILTSRAASLRRSRTLSVAVRSSEAATVSLKATTVSGGRTITFARGKAKFSAEGSVRQGLSLTKPPAARRSRRKRGITVKVVARAVDAAGNVGKASRSRRLSA